MPKELFWSLNQNHVSQQPHSLAIFVYVAFGLLLCPKSELLLLLLYVVIYSLLGNSRLFFQKRHNKNVPYRDYRIHFFQVYAIYDKLRWVSSENNLWNWRWMASIMKINDHEFLTVSENLPRIGTFVAADSKLSSILPQIGTFVVLPLQFICPKLELLW